MHILLVIPAGKHYRVQHGGSPAKRPMLRFSRLSVETVAALTPKLHTVEILDENVHPLDVSCPCDVVGISFMTAHAPRAYELAKAFRDHVFRRIKKGD